MWSESQIEDYLKSNLKASRFNHILGVRDTAEKLAKLYNCNVHKARMAALIHDCAKNMKDEDIISIIKEKGFNLREEDLLAPYLLHGLAGAIIAEDTMDIKDKEILNAAIYHTTGKKDMSVLEKIIYLADYIEPSRDFEGVDALRQAAFKDLDEGILKAFDNTICYVVARGQYLHKDTVEARNYMLLSQK